MAAALKEFSFFVVCVVFLAFVSSGNATRGRHRPRRLGKDVAKITWLTVRPGFRYDQTTEGAKIRIAVHPEEEGGENCTTGPLDVSSLQEEMSASFYGPEDLGSCFNRHVKGMKMKIDLSAEGKSVAGISIVEARFSDGSYLYCARGANHIVVFKRRPVEGVTCSRTHGGSRGHGGAEGLGEYYKYHHKHLSEPHEEATEEPSFHQDPTEDPTGGPAFHQEPTTIPELPPTPLPYNSHPESSEVGSTSTYLKDNNGPQKRPDAAQTYDQKYYNPESYNPRDQGPSETHHK